MTNLRRARHPGLFVVAVALCVTLSACGGSPTPPEPTGVITVAGSIQLPSGHGIDLARLSVSTPLGVYPVAATGEFEADVFDGADTEVGAETATGELLLLGVTEGDTLKLSLGSTAEALLYYAVGGMLLPADQQDTVRDLLRDRPEAGAVETELSRQLSGGGNGLASPDQATLDALQAAHAALFGDAGSRALWSAAQSAGGPATTQAGGEGAVKPAVAGGGNAIIEPASTVIAGVEVIHNPAGAGVVAQNHFRRPAAILAYETGWEDAEGVLTENDTPVPVATIDVPATGQLEFFEALLDVVTGDSPWSPVLSDQVSLPDHSGASRTHFTLVAVGPSGTDATWPIMDDERFDIFHGHWEDVENDKTIELFLDELLLPLVEVYGIGSLAKMDAAKLADLRRRMRLIHDEHLAGLGILLKNRQKGLVDGMKYALGEMAENGNFRMDLIDMVREAMGESDYNKFVFEGAEKRLSSRASASAIAAAVEALLVSGDVAKIMYDLASAPAAVSWSVVTSPALFVLVPDEGRVSMNMSSLRLSVHPKGESDGVYLYRWTTSGDHGSLSDLLKDGMDLTTSEPEIWYFHDDPAHIRDSDVDTVTVEVYEVAEGTTSVPPGAEPIARMTAKVVGDDRVLAQGIRVSYGMTELPPKPPPSAESRQCVEMYIHFPDPGASRFEVSLRGARTKQVPANVNRDFYYGPQNQHFIIDLNEDDVRDYVDVCKWRSWDGSYATRPTKIALKRDPEGGYMVHLFTLVDTPYRREQGQPSPGEAVALWYEWMKDLTVTAKPAPLGQ